MSRNSHRDRLRRTLWRPLSDDAKRRHHDAITDALAAIDRLEAAPAPPGWALRRRIGVAIGAVSLVLVPAAVIAAESAAPGDLLYPVKQVTEAVRSIVDDEVVPEHRVDELEELLDRDAPPEVITDHLVDTAREVDRLPTDHQLRERLTDLEVRITDRVTDAPATDEAPKDEPVTDTTEVVKDEPVVTDPPRETDRTTTTHPPRDSDRDG